MTTGRGKTVRMAFPPPPLDEVPQILAEHVPSDRFPEQCRCGSPYGQCWQRLGALEALKRAGR